MGPNPTYDVAYPYSSFKFDRSFYVNTTMMGEDVSYPVGDPNGSGLLYVQDLERRSCGCLVVEPILTLFLVPSGV